MCPNWACLARGHAPPAHHCLAVKLKLDILIVSVLVPNSLVFIPSTSEVRPRIPLDWRGSAVNTLHECEYRDRVPFNGRRDWGLLNPRLHTHVKVLIISDRSRL